MSKYITRRKRKKEITYVFERLHIILLIIPIKHRLPTNSYLRSLNIREKPYSLQRILIIYLITNSVIAIISHLRFNCLKKKRQTNRINFYDSPYRRTSMNAFVIVVTACTNVEHAVHSFLFRSFFGVLVANRVFSRTLSTITIVARP